MEEKISVIVPVYNVEKYLEACLSCLVRQTYQTLEIIVVDDGSTDGSGRICDEWALRDSRIKVIHKTNGGLSDARNVGLNSMSGDYVMFVDSDDLLADDLILHLYQVLNAHHADVAVCDPVHIFEGRHWSYEKLDMVTVYTAQEAVKEMWYQKSFLPAAWGKLYKKELFDKVRFRGGILFEDIDMMHEIFYRSGCIAYDRSKLYGYLHRDDSITTKKFSKKDTEIQNICLRLVDFTKDKPPELQRAAKAYCATGNLRVYLNAPRNHQYDMEIKQASNILNLIARDVLSDHNIRKKLRYGLFLYLYFRPFLKLIYSKIDRWK